MRRSSAFRITLSLVLALAAIWPAAALAQPDEEGTVPPPRSLATATDDLFTLTITTPKTSWALGEPIEIAATLAYIGAAPRMTVTGSGGGIVNFGIEQLDGPFDMAPFVIASGQGYDFSAGDVMAVPFAKTGAYDADSLTAVIWRPWFDDPELRPPPGTYRIYAVADYDVPDVPVTDELRAEVVVEVSGLPAPDPSVAPAPTRPETSAMPSGSSPPSPAPFPWPTLPPPEQVPVPARFEPTGPPDGTTTRHGIRVELWLSSPTVAPGEWIGALVRTTNLRDDPAWAWSGECRTSGTTATVDLSPVIPMGQEQTGNAAAFKEAAIWAGYVMGSSFSKRRDLPRSTSSAGDSPAASHAFVECGIAQGPRRLKKGATTTDRFAWYAASSYDGEVWFQPLPPGKVSVTASWPFLSRGTPPKVGFRRGARLVEPITATTAWS